MRPFVWPELRFPPINLWSMPRQRFLDERPVTLTAPKFPRPAMVAAVTSRLPELLRTRNQG